MKYFLAMKGKTDEGKVILNLADDMLDSPNPHQVFEIDHYALINLLNIAIENWKNEGEQRDENPS